DIPQGRLGRRAVRSRPYATLAAMNQVLRLFAIAFVFALTSAAWVVLGGVMTDRSHSQGGALRDRVADLWGQPHVQSGPELAFSWVETRDTTREEVTGGVVRVITNHVAEAKSEPVSPASSHISADLHLDQRLKGLMWYSLYDVAFAGSWKYVHDAKQSGMLA